MKEYDWPVEFQRKLLWLYIRKPETIREFVQPAYFGPLHCEIAGWIANVYRENPETRFTKPSLYVLVKAALGDKRAEAWHETFKPEIRRLCEQPTDDDDFVAKQAIDFGMERKFRRLLVDAEGAINCRDYEGAIQRFEKVKTEFHRKRSDTPGSATTLPAFYLHQFLGEENEQDTDDLVRHIVPKSGATLVYGLPKELKSWFGLQLAVDLAAGRERALGYFPVPRAAKVLYVQVEDRDTLTRERLAMVTRDGNLRRYRTINNLRVVPRCGLNLSDPVWAALLKQEVEKHKPEMIVMDVFRRLFIGNPSDSQEVATFVRVLDDLRDANGCAIVLVHHSRKSSEGEMQAKALGSVNLTGWAEALLFTHGKRKVGEASIAELEITTKTLVESLEIVVDAETEPVVQVRARSNPVELLKTLMREKPDIEFHELQKKSAVSEKRLRKILDDGIRDEMWTEKQLAIKGNHKGYRLAHEG